ncbi:16S rRNA (cytosine(1402)-N(4))-methyltransferase RsmH [Oscillospiraceae bacterium CM]|nr:16S rRNA (cytosine(1402)-N(4))-methyltransferase RsmH [Oscillospiraceae bacterium CM]
MAHTPVLLEACINGLHIKPGGTYVDATLGRAGHAQEIAKRLESGRLIGIDRDEAAISAAGETLKAFAGKVTLVRGDFRNIGAILDTLGLTTVDGMLFDLGVSSPQLDEAARGFSYRTDAPLDMRMDKSAALTAFDIVNTWPENDLKRILYAYGEERHAPRIAAAIIKRRAVSPVNTTLELSDIIRAAMPAAALREKQHPAKRTFQAIRIAVNDELGAIEEMLSTAPDRLASNGRLCIISFHSLEDRLVKNAIARRERGCTCPPDFPVCVCGFVPTLRTVTKKPITPDAAELEQNPRSRSAKLRIAERV